MDVQEFRALAQQDPMLPERIIQTFYRAILSPTSTAIDCGAHTGYHTRPLAEWCNKGTVVAYEGLPHLAEKLTKTFEAKPHVHIRNVAIQDDPSMSSTTFQFVPERPGRSGIRSATINTGSDNAYEYQELTVSATTVDADLDTLSIPHDSIEFMKLDLEGGEFAALRGAEKVLSLGRPLLAIENGFHAARVGRYTPEDVATYFESLNYRRFSIFGNLIDETDFDFWYVFASPIESLDLAIQLTMSIVAAAVHRSVA